MRTTLVVALVLVLVLGSACSGRQEPRPSSHPIEVQDGITFTGGWSDAFHGPKPMEAMTNLADTGAGWIAIVITWYQSRIASTQNHPMKATPPDDELVRMIRLAHDLGLRVMLKPHIDLVRTGGTAR